MEVVADPVWVPRELAQPAGWRVSAGCPSPAPVIPVTQGAKPAVRSKEEEPSSEAPRWGQEHDLRACRQSPVMDQVAVHR